MLKPLVALLSCAAAFFVFLVGIDEAELTAPILLQGEIIRSDSSQNLAFTSSRNLVELEGQNLSNAPVVRDLAHDGSNALIDFERKFDHLLATGINVEALSVKDERMAAFSQLADYNTAQLYIALWQTLDGEELDDVDFQEFVLATLMELGDQSPGEVLAVLVQDSNHAVRMAAFSTLEDMSDFAPVWLVAHAAVNDPDPQIRMRALELLTYGDRQTATEVLTVALGDPNPAISDLAADLLTGLDEDQS
jgi:HEAT repeat protein